MTVLTRAIVGVYWAPIHSPNWGTGIKDMGFTFQCVNRYNRCCKAMSCSYILENRHIAKASNIFISRLCCEPTGPKKQGTGGHGRKLPSFVVIPSLGRYKTAFLTLLNILFMKLRCKLTLRLTIPIQLVRVLLDKLLAYAFAPFLHRFQ